MKRLAFLLYFAIFVLSTTIPVSAACHAIYGGGNMCEQHGKITIDKFIKNPQTEDFVDTLTPQESFSPNSTIEFRIIVKNTDTRNIKTITVKDMLPEPLVYISSQGKYDSATRTVTFDINELKKDESKTFTVQAKANEPTDTSCFANFAQMIQARNINQDATDFCIQGTQTGSTNQLSNDQTNQTPSTTKGGQPIYNPQQTSETPGTGPELLGLIGLIPAGLGGMYLRRKAIK